MKWWIALLVIGSAGRAAAQQPIDGNQLYEWGVAQEALDAKKNDASPYKAGMFAGFVAGVTNSHRGLKSLYPNDYPFALCIPEAATGNQIGAVVMKYLRAHPEQRQTAAADLVWGALHEAWPCPEPDKTKSR